MSSQTFKVPLLAFQLLRHEWLDLGAQCTQLSLSNLLPPSPAHDLVILQRQNCTAKREKRYYDVSHQAALVAHCSEEAENRKPHIVSSD